MEDIVYSLMAGVILLLFSAFIYKSGKSIVSPAFIFSFTWGVCLIALSASPLIGFYSIVSNSIFIFLFGAILFSAVSFFSEFYFEKINSVKKESQLLSLNYNSILKVNLFLLIVFIPILVQDLTKFGASIDAIAYAVRRASTNGEEITSPIVSNFFLFEFYISILLFYGALKNKISLVHTLASLFPFFFFSLLLSGRSGLMGMVLAWLFIYLFVNGKFNWKALIGFMFLAYLLIYFGATLVNKVDVKDKGMLESTAIMLTHIADYLLQGPILFSRYFDSEISIRENWDALNSACVIISKFDLCEPLAQHADFAYYSNESVGNVYTLYFSIYPKYSYLGLVLFIGIYSLLVTFSYCKAKEGNSYFFVISAFFFSAIILSVFKDGIGYSLWNMVKFYFFNIIILTFFRYKESVSK